VALINFIIDQLNSLILIPIGLFAYYGVLKVIEESIRSRQQFIAFWEEQKTVLSELDLKKKIPWDYSVKTRNAILDPEMKSLRRKIRFLQSRILERSVAALIAATILGAIISLSIRNWN
jgi:hypothetical protein